MVSKWNIIPSAEALMYLRTPNKSFNVHCGINWKKKKKKRNKEGKI